MDGADCITAVLLTAQLLVCQSSP